MQDQNRARKDTKAKGGGPQAQQQPVMRWTLCKEVKVVTVREEQAPHPIFDSPDRILDLWRAVIINADWYTEDREHLVSFCLDTRRRLKSFSLVSIGTLNESLAHPREIFRSAIADAASAVIVAHNHPSGDPNPSNIDVALTRRLYSAGDLLQIPLLDQIIVAGQRYFSFRECSSGWPPREYPIDVIPEGRPAIEPAREVIVHLTQDQWLVMKMTNSIGSVVQFLAHATRDQLLKLRDATPVRFETNYRGKRKGESPARFVFVRNLHPLETDDWSRAKFQRNLVKKALKLSGIRE